MTASQAAGWERFHIDRATDHYPRWPNEVMVKLVYGTYLERPIALPERARVLDVGCGFGNNLMPFLIDGHECYGVEVTEEIAALAAGILADRGLRAEISSGSNRSLPYPDEHFDLLLSMNVLHYEQNGADIQAALREYHRVLRPGGSLVLSTVGPDHEIARRAEPLGGHVHRIRDYDFRDGQLMWFADSLEHLAETIGATFDEVETADHHERIGGLEHHWLLGVARRR